MGTRWDWAATMYPRSMGPIRNCVVVRDRNGRVGAMPVASGGEQAEGQRGPAADSTWTSASPVPGAWPTSTPPIVGSGDVGVPGRAWSNPRLQSDAGITRISSSRSSSSNYTNAADGSSPTSPGHRGRLGGGSRAHAYTPASPGGVGRSERDGVGPVQPGQTWPSTDGGPRWPPGPGLGPSGRGRPIRTRLVALAADRAAPARRDPAASAVGPPR